MTSTRKLRSTYWITKCLSDEHVNKPEWIEIEKRNFLQHRDLNGDGSVDLNELREWLHPNGVPPALAEAKHLIALSDKDKDGFLTTAEIVNNFRVFVGSQATDYGRMLHNELWGWKSSGLLMGKWLFFWTRKFHLLNLCADNFIFFSRTEAIKE